MDTPTLSAVDFNTALAQMRTGKPVTAADLIEIADEAHAAAERADIEAAICRDMEADARGMALLERAKDYGLLPELAA